MVVINFPHIEMNGILRYFYSKDTKYYSRYLKYDQSGQHESYPTVNIFNFTSTSYWTARSTSVESYVSFCFVGSIKAKLIGYEIKSSQNEYRGKQWTFAGSNDNTTWYDTTPESHSLEKNEIYYSNWNKKPYRCFKLTCIENVANSEKRFDVAKLELFGKLMFGEECTCKKINSKLSMSLLDSLMILLLTIN